jgi:hypothetical protein
MFSSRSGRADHDYVVLTVSALVVVLDTLLTVGTP